MYVVLFCPHHSPPGLVAINTTLLTYAAVIVVGGAAIGLLLYLLATSRYKLVQYNIQSNNFHLQPQPAIRQPLR